MKKNTEPEMTVELAPEEPKAVETVGDDSQAQAVADGDDAPAAPSPDEGQGKGATLRQLKAQASEDDDAPIATLTLRQIVGGDFLLALVRHYVWFIVLVVLLTCVYVGVRYQCQQDVIEISRLEKELIDAKYRAMSSSSNLTELCRQSNVLKVLSENEDNELMLPDQPPYIVPVEE